MKIFQINNYWCKSIEKLIDKRCPIYLYEFLKHKTISHNKRADVLFIFFLKQVYSLAFINLNHFFN